MSRTVTIAKVLERLLVALALAFVTMVLTAVAATLVSQREVQITRTVYGPLVDNAAALEVSLASTQASHRGYAVMKDPQYLAEYRDGIARSRAMEAELARDMAGVMEPTELRAVQADTETWVRLSGEVVATVEAGGTADLSHSAPAFRRLRASTEALIDATERVRQEHRLVDVRVGRIGIAVNLAVALVALALVAWAVHALREGLARPMARLASGVREQERGAQHRAVEVPGAALEVVEVADAVNRLTAAHQEATRIRERDVELGRCTEQVARELIARPAERSAWDGAARTLGEALDTDEVGFYRRGCGGEEVLVGGWRRDGGTSRELLSRVDPAVLSEAARAAGTGLLTAHRPEEMARALPAHVASIAVENDVQAWCLAPLMLQEELLGLISIKQWRPSTRDTQAELAIARVAATAAVVLAERRYVESLEDLDQQKSAFMATTSHELRTPLTSIAGYLELLEDGDFGELSPPQAKAVSVIDRNVTRLRALIDDLLLLNRLDSGAADESRSPVVIPDLVAGVLESLEPTAAAKGVSLQVEETGCLPPAQVLGASDQLERALANLVANAVKFTPAGGRVQVRMRCSGPDDPRTGAGWVEIMVVDTGIGVPAADLDRLFTRFFRAGNAERSQTPGTGLGLVIVKTIVERHGGSVTAASVEGEGTTMTVRLPRLDARV